MSSNIRIIKVCEYCKNEFIAKKTTSKTCSIDCARRFHRFTQRDAKIALAKLRSEINKTPKAFINEDQIKVIQTKELLTLKEAALLLNISALTFRRWILSGKITSTKIGKKHLIKRCDITSLLA